MYTMNVGIGINGTSYHQPYRRRPQNKIAFHAGWGANGYDRVRPDGFGPDRYGNIIENEIYIGQSCSSSSSSPPIVHGPGPCQPRQPPNQTRVVKITRPSTEIESLTKLMKMPADDAIKFIQKHRDDFLLFISEGRIRNRPLNLLIQIIAVKLCAPTSLLDAQDTLIAMFTTHKYLLRILDYTNELMETLHCRFNVIPPYCSPIEILEYLYVYYNFALIAMPNNISIMFLENVQSADRLMAEVRWSIENSRNVKALMEYMESFRRIEIPLTNLRQQLMQLQFTLQDKHVPLTNPTKSQFRAISAGDNEKEPSQSSFITDSEKYFPSKNVPNSSDGTQFRCNAGNTMGSKTLRTLLRLSTDGAILFLQKQFQNFSTLITQPVMQDYDISLLIKVLGDKLSKPTIHRELQSKLISVITTRDLLHKLFDHTHQLVVDLYAGLNKMPRCRCALKTLNHLFNFYNFALPHMEVSCMDSFQDNVYSAHMLLQNFLLQGNHENLKPSDLNSVQCLEQLFASLKDILDSNMRLQSRFMRIASVDVDEGDRRSLENPQKPSVNVVGLANVNQKMSEMLSRPMEKLIIQLNCHSSSWSDTQDTFSTNEHDLNDDTNANGAKASEVTSKLEVSQDGLSVGTPSDFEDSAKSPKELLSETKFPSHSTTDIVQRTVPTELDVMDSGAEVEKKEIKHHSGSQNTTLVAGFVKNLFFINHREPEQVNKITGDKSNEYEARYLVNLYRHLILQNYHPSQITVLVMHQGQKLLLKEVWIGSDQGPCSSMRVEAVDTYDDEGSDIIILSLVQSNDKSNTGVVESENRMCKALARARNGLYIIGNMTCHLNSQSELWPFIYCDLDSKQSIGEQLKLQCQVHGDVYSIDSPDDFKVKAPDGGCFRPCNATLPKCSHRCDKYCHIVDPEHTGYKCEVVMDAHLKCGHTHQVPCFMIYTDSLEEVVCDTTCGAELKCGHSCPDTCHAVTNPGHDKYLCKEKKECRRRCVRDHPCPSNHLCYQDCHPCTELVDKTLPCGHLVMNAVCSVDPVTLKCVHKCDTKLNRKNSKKCVLS